MHISLGESFKKILRQYVAKDNYKLILLLQSPQSFDS